MKNAYTEFDLLKELDQKIGVLDQEAQQRVINYIIAKYNLQLKPSLKSDKSELDLVEEKDQSVKDFIAQKKPNGFYERIACLVFYLEKRRGLDGCKTIDITNINSEARLSRIPNSALYVAHATATYGYLAPIGKGKKAITARGEALVNALPDRATVVNALKEYPLKKRISKNKKKE